MTENASQLGTYFSYYTDQTQDFLGKGNQQPARDEVIIM